MCCNFVNIKIKLAKVGLSVTLFAWLFVSFISASAAVVCVDYAKTLFSFKAPNFIALLQKSSWVLNIPPLIHVLRKYNAVMAMPSKSEWAVYLLIGVVGAFETYLKATALTLLTGSTYTILFESDLVWNVILSVTFLKRCYHPLQFLSPVFIAGSVFLVTFTSDNSSGTTDPTGMGQFGGVIIAVTATFLTGLGAILSDYLLKKMMATELKRKTEQENLVGIITQSEADYQSELLERNKSKIWYQNMEEVRNLEFTFWTSFLTFIFLIIWTLVDPTKSVKEYTQWPKYFDTVRQSSGHTAQWNMAIFIIIMSSLAISRLFVRLSMNYILMVLSAFFFAVWKPFRRIGTIFLSIALFGDSFGLYKGLSILLDVTALLLFALGGYYYRLQKKMEREKNIDLE